ncbi:MAG: type II secretion system F family protein [Candidatus Omnitrophota bacterium]|nr:MAG: type II secretion system F family protein [Candidatus Omnitrophota bacterium]
MPKYIYSAKTDDAKTIRDIEEARSREELVAKLRARGLFIVSVKEVKEREGRPSRIFRFLHKKGKHTSISVYDFAFLARNLATTLSSGVTLLRSLELLASQTESIKLEKVLADCSRCVREGLSLSEAVAKFPSVFSPLWRGIVEVGESSGNLPFVLDKLAEYLELRMEFERRIKSALVYPVILIFAAILAILVFLKAILPKFITLFEEFEVELPMSTKIIFGLSRIVERHLFFIVVGVILVGVGIYLFIKHPRTRELWNRTQLKMPFVGQLTFLGCLERLSSTFYILLDSGLPLVSALEVCARGVGNVIFEKAIFSIKDKVRDGAALSSEFSRFLIFPLLISEMVRIGEETGTMPEVFHRISIHYQKELTTRVERLVAAFEPAMIILMGILIGGMVISLFLPIFQLSTLGVGG